jgi:mannose-1-phosphate guanylyltransferase
MAYVGVAFDAIQENPDSVILLGIEPERPEVQYGWIEPGESVPSRQAIGIYRIRRFWEKPGFERAKSLFAHDCLWNTFVIVACIPSILQLVEVATPELFRAFSRLQTVLGTDAEARAVESLFDAIPNTDFSRDVLATHSERLAVLPVPGVSWDEWGEPRRVLNSLRSMRRVDGGILSAGSMSD